jgi:hypothetical protein
LRGAGLRRSSGDSSAEKWPPARCRKRASSGRWPTSAFVTAFDAKKPGVYRITRRCRPIPDPLSGSPCGGLGTLVQPNAVLLRFRRVEPQVGDKGVLVGPEPQLVFRLAGRALLRLCLRLPRRLTPLAHGSQVLVFQPYSCPSPSTWPTRRRRPSLSPVRPVARV